ncbi:probable calcium-binding protein CML47 [Argentina anserina]|uniref:probable calcium-binding protein CML47 n=1 Tax=Argentina anserina TaxID=57926 RepID=UPI002176309E|nr:probable calcium-binding protein CML47 [Potentilla anserina]
MEKTFMDEAIASSSLALVGVLFLLMIIKCLIVQFVLHLSSLRYALQFSVSCLLTTGLRNVSRDNQTKITNQKASIYETVGVEESTKDLGDKKLCLGELASVVENLGRLCDDNGSKEMADLLEEEPSLEEVKEAFHLFDENTDGFIDAGEIKKVLHVLGFVQASESECKRMIKTFDHNGDGRIDFEEFLKLMEDSFC